MVVAPPASSLAAVRLVRPSRRNHALKSIRQAATSAGVAFLSSTASSSHRPLSGQTEQRFQRNVLPLLAVRRHDVVNVESCADAPANSILSDGKASQRPGIGVCLFAALDESGVRQERAGDNLLDGIFSLFRRQKTKGTLRGTANGRQEQQEALLPRVLGPCAARRTRSCRVRRRRKCDHGTILSGGTAPSTGRSCVGTRTAPR